MLFQHPCSELPVSEVSSVKFRRCSPKTVTSKKNMLQLADGQVVVWALIGSANRKMKLREIISLPL